MHRGNSHTPLNATVKPMTKDDALDIAIALSRLNGPRGQTLEEIEIELGYTNPWTPQSSTKPSIS
mgnify:FL=1